MHVLDEAPMPDGSLPAALSTAKDGLARALADALRVGLKIHTLRSAAEAAEAAFAKAREVERATLAAQHNASEGPGGPRLLPLCLELQVAIVNKAYSDR